MTDEETRPKRWRPRFSIRSLVVVVTLAATYFACWDATKRYGVDQVEDHCSAIGDTAIIDQAKIVVDGGSPIPLVVQFETFSSRDSYCHYYFWFFGYVAKLPYDRDI